MKTIYGDRSFSVHGPTAWYSLPYDLQSTDVSLDKFTNKMKTFQFDADMHLLRIWAIECHYYYYYYYKTAPDECGKGRVPQCEHTTLHHLYSCMSS